MLGGAGTQESCLQEVFIVSALRTPIGKFGGSLAHMTAADMGTVAARAALERAAVAAAQVEETIIGNARQAGAGPTLRGRFPFVPEFPKRYPRIQSIRLALRD